MPTKIGLHAFHINLYLHEFFEPILFFDPDGVYGLKMKFQLNLKSSKISENGPPKLVCIHFTSNSTCMNFLSRFYFLTPLTI